MLFDARLIRPLFPALNESVEGNRPPIFFDNPGGTQVPQTVIDAVANYYISMNANAGGAFATSRRSDEMVQSAREWVADFLNATNSSEIVFGPNMTSLNFALSRALAKTFAPGDEIVVTRMDHDGNISPWLRIAEDHGLTVQWVDILADDCTLDMRTLEAALTGRTKIVAVVHASNAVGTINPVRNIVDLAHAVGALCVIDGVQSAPHIPIDVQAIGCDVLFCSAYKFFGPHCGIMWGRHKLLEELPAYKIRPSNDQPPYRWETGTPCFEAINGVAAAIEYLMRIGEQFGTGDFPGFSERRLALKQGMAATQAYERTLVEHLIRGLESLPGVTIAGITDPARFDQRVPTVAFVMREHRPPEIAAFLDRNNIYVWHGHYYAVEIMRRLGHAEHGMVRVGLAHYNTATEIDHFITVLASLAG